MASTARHRAREAIHRAFSEFLLLPMCIAVAFLVLGLVTDARRCPGANAP